MNRLLLFICIFSLLVGSSATAATISSVSGGNELVIDMSSDLSIWESQTGGTWRWTYELAMRWIPNWTAQDPAQFDQAMPPPLSGPVLQPAPMPPSVPSVPEPTAALLFAAGFMVLIVRRKR